MTLTRQQRRELTGLRLASQRIAAPNTGSPASVVRHLLAMQAQDLAGAKWSVGLRTGTTEAEIAAALAAGEIVRSWPMRGTLHFTAPEDLGWMLAISRVRQATWAAKRRRDLEITDLELGRAGELAQALMTGGKAVRRDDLLGALEAEGISTASQRGYHFIWNLAQDGLILHGPADGKQQTFVLFEEWITEPRTLDGDEALGEFARRYFASHGPATERDFSWWASLTLSDARIGIALADLETREFEGTTYYVEPGLTPAKAAVFALPGFDEYLLGYQDRSPVLDAAFSDRIVPGNNGIFQPTLVVDGRVVGTWKRTESAKQLTVDLVPFEPVAPRVTEGFGRQMKRLARYSGTAVIVRD